MATAPITFNKGAGNLDLWEQMLGYGAGSVDRTAEFSGLAPGTKAFSQEGGGYLFRGPDLGHRTALQTTGAVNPDGTVTTGKFKPHQRISGGQLLGEGLSLAALAFGGLGALGAGPMAGLFGGAGAGGGAVAGDLAAGIPGGVLPGGVGGATGGVGATLGTPAVSAGMAASNPYAALAANAAGGAAPGAAGATSIYGLGGGAGTTLGTAGTGLTAGTGTTGLVAGTGGAGLTLGGMTPAAAGATLGGGGSFLGGVGDWLSGAAGNMKPADWLQLISGGVDLFRGADQIGGARDQIDPFGEYRAGYARQLADLMQNPSSVTKLPGYQASMDAAEQALVRQHAAAGGLGGGGLAEALAKFGGQFQNQAFDEQIKRLAGLSGATFNNAGEAYEAEGAGYSTLNRFLDNMTKLSIFNQQP